MMFRGFYFSKKTDDEIKEQQKEEEPPKPIKLTQLKCENCGSNLSLSNVVNGAIKCQYCGAEYVQGEVQKAEVMQEEDSLYCDGDVVTSHISNPYVILNIAGKERKFYIASMSSRQLFCDLRDYEADKIQIELIEI